MHAPIVLIPVDILWLHVHICTISWTLILAVSRLNVWSIIVFEAHLITNLSCKVLCKILTERILNKLDSNSF